MAFPIDWNRKCKLIISASQVEGDVLNFPILLDEDCLHSEIFDADGSYPALNGGGDIRFSSDVEGITQLACEIEQFVTDNNPANGKAAIWVKVPNISSSVNTVIYIWYSKSGESQPAETDSYGKHAVWGSDFKMIQHMNQDPSISSPQMIDSTSNNNDGTSGGVMLTGDQVAGQIDGSLDFDGGGDFIDCGAGASLNITSDQITIETWIKPSDMPYVSGSTYRMIAAKGQWKYGLIFNASTDELLFRIDGIGVTEFSYTEDSQWHHLVGTYNGSKMKIYFDGVLKNECDVSGDIATTAEDFLIGKYGGDRYFKGGIDEVCVSEYAHSIEWIQTRFNNQNSPSTFMTFGAPYSYGILAQWGRFTTTEEDEGEIYDLTGNNNTGVLHDDASLNLIGARGRVLNFSGSDASVRIPDSPTVSPTAAVSVGAWIYKTDMNQAMIVDKDACYRLWIPLNDNVPCFNVYAGGAWREFQATGLVIPTNQWVFLQAGYDSVTNTVQMYCQGSMNSENTSWNHGVVNDNSYQLYLGKYSPGGYLFKGYIGEVIIRDELIDLSTHRIDLKRWLKKRSRTVIEFLELHIKGVSPILITTDSESVVATVYDIYTTTTTTTSSTTSSSTTSSTISTTSSSTSSTSTSTSSSTTTV